MSDNEDKTNKVAVQVPNDKSQGWVTHMKQFFDFLLFIFTIRLILGSCSNQERDVGQRRRKNERGRHAGAGVNGPGQTSLTEQMVNVVLQEWQIKIMGGQP